MEPEQLREDQTTPNLKAVLPVMLSPSNRYPKSPAQVLPHFVDVMEMETIIEFDEEDISPSICSTPGHLNLTSFLANTSHQFQSPDPNTPSPFQSPTDYSHPLPPNNTPTTGRHGQAALLQSCQQQLLVNQAAVKLATVTASTQQFMKGGPCMELLRDSLTGMCEEYQLQESEDLIRTAAAFIQFCRKKEGEELSRQFMREEEEIGKQFMGERKELGMKEERH